MKLLQLAFIVFFGGASFAAYATSQTLHLNQANVAQDQSPALTSF